MHKNMRKGLFGFKTRDVLNEIQQMDSNHQKELAQLQSAIEKAKLELTYSEEQIEQLKKQLNEYKEREHLVAEVMVTAQINAQRIEESAKERARIMIAESEEELKQKQQELDSLRIKVVSFKQDFRETLDNYRISLERISEAPAELSFVPTLITKEKNNESTCKLEIPS